jgi:hypothetical protein
MNKKDLGDYLQHLFSPAARICSAGAQVSLSAQQFCRISYK